LYEKTNGDKRFVVVDGAMNDLIRPSLYKAFHKVKAISKNKENISKADIVGPVCESGDFLAKDEDLPILNHGDLIVLESAGAYGFTMSSNYNTRGRVAEVALQNGKDRLIRERESFEDLIEKEKKFLEN
jgi:diaminopimelate decarboxylase